MRGLWRPALACSTALAFGVVGCAPAEAPPAVAPPAPAVVTPSPSPSAPSTAANVLRFQGIASLGSTPLKDASLKAFDLASGKELAIVAGGAGNIVAGGAGNIVAGGAGNIVAGGAGNIVAGGAGNIVAGGAGNIVAGGAGNHRVLAQSGAQGDRPASALGDNWATAPQRTDLTGAFDCAIVGLRPTQAIRLVARSGNTTLVSLLGGNGFSLGGNIVAGGAGNIVAGGAGNIVAGGAGNIVAGGAGNIVAGGAGNIVAGGAGNIVAGGAGNRRVLQEGGASGAPVAPSAARLDLTLRVGLSPATTVAAKTFEGTLKLQYQLPEALVGQGIERAVDVINEAMARLEAELSSNEGLATELTGLLNESGDLVSTQSFNATLQEAGLADRLASLVQTSLTRYVEEIVAAGGPARREEFTNLRSEDFPVGPVTLRADGELIFTDPEGKVVATQVVASQIESEAPDEEVPPPPPPEDDDLPPFVDGQAQGDLTVRDGVLRQPTASEALVP